MHRRRVGIALVLATVCGSVSGQTVCRDTCGGVLDKAAYNEIKLKKQSYTNEEIRNAFCSIRDSVQQSSDSTSADVLTQAFLAHYRNDRESYSREYSRICLKQAYKFLYEDRISLLAKLVNPQSVTTWSGCMRDCMQKYGYGFQYQVENDDGTAFVLKMRWSPALGINKVPVREVQQRNVTCSISKLKNLTSEWRPLACVRGSMKSEKSYVTILSDARYGGFAVAVDAPSPVADVPPYFKAGYKPRLTVLVHQENFGDQAAGNGDWAGIKNQSRRLEGFSVDLAEVIPGVAFQYLCHVESNNDIGWKNAGELCGFRGRQLRLEGFAIRLIGENASRFSLTYACHVENFGDIGPIAEPNFCGTRGLQRRIESLQVNLQAK